MPKERSGYTQEQNSIANKMVQFFDITQCFSLLHVVRTITLVLFASQLCSQVFRHHVEATSAQNGTILQTPSTFRLYSFADYKNLFKSLQDGEDSEMLEVYFYRFKCMYDIEHFLGILAPEQYIFSNDCPDSTISLLSNDEFRTRNDGNTDSSIRFSFPFESTSAVSEEFSKLTTFKIMIGPGWSNGIKGVVSNYKEHDIHFLFKTVYVNFSYETQRKICLQIKELFPSSIITQCLNEKEIFNEQDLFFLYGQRLREAETFENEGEVMESLLMTLLMEGINDVFIKKLSKEFKNLDVIIQPGIPILLDFISLEHFSCLENIQLYGDYFETISQSQIKPLSAAPIQTMDLRNLNLIKSFFEFLFCYSKEKSIDFKSKDYVSSASDIEIFKILTSLNLAVPLSADMHQQIELIKLLPSLKTIKIKGTLEELQPILQLLKDYANLSSLDTITVKFYVCNHCMTYKVIDIKRNADGNSFNALDFNLSHLKSENNQRNEIEKAVEILNE